jgi:phage minor structural protein
MILLNGHTLTPMRKIDAEKLSLSLKERDSTATLTYADMSDIGITSWFKDDTEPGDGIVWRVRGFQQMYDQRTTQINLEHVINTLKDFILFGEITPADITGHDDAEECEARQAIEYVLAHQMDWILGSFDSSYEDVHNNYSFNGDSLFDALSDISSTLEDAWWSYDMSVYPFRLNITKKSDAVACELRPGRNIKTLSKTIDRTNLYTRFYPIGYDDLHITGEYVSRNESLYGVVSKVETDTSKETEAELIDWANQKLGRHAEPRVTISVNGLELADATGESLDRLTLGRMCRIPLAEFGTTLTERITELKYTDKIGQREAVQITLSNTSDDVMQFLADEIKNGSGPSGGGSRTSAVQQKEDHAWIEMTDSRVSIIVDSNGNVKPAEIVAAINDGSSSIRISADHIDIDGLVTKLQTIQLETLTLTTSGNIVSYGGTVGQSIAINQNYGITNSGRGVFNSVTVDGKSLDFFELTIGGQRYFLLGYQ